MIDEALSKYNFKKPEAIFIRHNENITYEINDGDNKYLLRIHKAAEGLDFSLNYGDTPRHILIESEIELLKKLHDIGYLRTQYPIKNHAGDYITHLENGELVTVLSWLDGNTLINTDITEEMVYHIGQMIGKLHNATAQISKVMAQIQGVNRVHYDKIFINRALMEIKNAYEMAHIDLNAYEQMKTILEKIKWILKVEQNNFLLIHSDLSKSNIIVDKDSFSPIDFSLSGYGIPEMELGQIISSFNKVEYLSSLIAGYESVRDYKVNQSYIKAFSALSVILYIVIHHNNLYKDESFNKAMIRWCNTLFILEDEQRLESIDH